MARGFKRRALSESDLCGARAAMIVFAILNLLNAALTISEYQAENRVPLSAWGSMAISVFGVICAAVYQHRLDRNRELRQKSGSA